MNYELKNSMRRVKRGDVVRVVGLWSVAWLEACCFFEDQCLEGLFGQVVEFHVEFERSLGDRLVGKKIGLGIRHWIGSLVTGYVELPHLISRVVVLLQIGVCQGLLHLNPLMGVKGQHLIQQIQSYTIKQ